MMITAHWTFPIFLDTNHVLSSEGATSKTIPNSDQETSQKQSEVAEPEQVSLKNFQNFIYHLNLKLLHIFQQ